MNLLRILRFLFVAWAPIAISFGVVKIILDLYDPPDVVLSLSAAVAGIGVLLLQLPSASTLGQMKSRSTTIIIFASVLFAALTLLLRIIIIDAIFVGYLVGVLFVFTVSSYGKD